MNENKNHPTPVGVDSYCVYRGEKRVTDFFEGTYYDMMPLMQSLAAEHYYGKPTELTHLHATYYGGNLTAESDRKAGVAIREAKID